VGGVEDWYQVDIKLGLLNSVVFHIRIFACKMLQYLDTVENKMFTPLRYEKIIVSMMPTRSVFSRDVSFVIRRPATTIYSLAATALLSFTADVCGLAE